MPKSINLGNGSLLIGLDKFGQVKDLYFHYAGLENHINNDLVHKIGFMVDGEFSWISDDTWNVVVESEKETMVSKITAENKTLGILLGFSDVVYNEDNIFIRAITITNKFDRKRKIKVFFNQQFTISETRKGNTAYYDPIDNVVIHYKGRRVFLINARVGTRGINDYSVGLLGIEGKEGTYKDAEDGELTRNPIEHGQVDSVIELDVEIDPKSSETVHYWISVGKSIEKVKKLNESVVARNPQDFIETTTNYWKTWANLQNFNFYGLDEKTIELFKKSLIYIRTHVNKNGSIIASADSDMFQFERDTYSYVWPRDAAFAVLALSGAGDFNASRRFFEFSRDVLTDKGYFMHKYRPDKSLGSSWHPWIDNGKEQRPIQEDETALVLYALWNYFELSKDLEFIESIYNSFIKKSADFMASFRDEKTGLPMASYDIWEMYYGISTFTSSAVFGALQSASKFAKLLGKSESEKKYNDAAETIQKAILKYLYNKEEEVFYKYINTSNKEIIKDKTIDCSSLYGLFKFEVLPMESEILTKTFTKTLDRLTVDTKIGGIARYEGDTYRFGGGNFPGNPWVITTMWIAQYYIGKAKKESDLEEVKKWLSWVVELANPAGILPEQFDPYTGEHLSASPLIESHAEFVNTIISYLKKLEELGISKVYNTVL